MKYSFKLEDLDCAVCASKMEEAIKKIKGVNEASVNFIMQKLVIDIEDTFDFDDVMKEVVKTCKKVEPDCVILR